MNYTTFKLGQRQPECSTDAGTAAAVQVMAITGGKGGAGKSIITANLAQLLAAAGRKVLLLDADLGMANLDTLLGVEARHTLLDVINGCRTLDEIVLTAPCGLRVIPAASGVTEMADLGRAECAGLIRAFSDMSTPVDTLLIDTATGIHENVISFCRAAGEIVVVTTCYPASLRDACGLINVLYRDHGVTRFRILPNKVNSAHEASALLEHMLYRFRDAHDLSLSCCGYIPRDEALYAAACRHELVVDMQPDSPASLALASLAGQVLRWPRPSVAGGHLEFFVERLIQNEKSAMEVRS